MEHRKKSSTNYRNEQQLMQCPVTYTLSVIGGRWKAAIIWKLSQRAMRFGELREAVGGISDRMLAKQLGELRDDGLVSRELLEEAPRKTVYELTEQGRSLEPVLDAILKWGLSAQQPL